MLKFIIFFKVVILQYYKRNNITFLHEAVKRDEVCSPFVCYSLTAFYRLRVVFH